jgi:hypothetical protein
MNFLTGKNAEFGEISDGHGERVGRHTHPTRVLSLRFLALGRWAIRFLRDLGLTYIRISNVQVLV